MRAVLDIDGVKYTAASAGEKRTVKVVHKSSGREIECKTRTEFYGSWQKKDGGMLAEINKKSKKEFTPDDFEYIDVQTPEPIENVLHTAKMMVTGWLSAVNADDHIAFMGKGDSFRVERSTLLKYKGNRETMLKPVLLNEVSEYLAKKFNVEIVKDIEADDACIIEAYQKKDRVVVSYDKDMKGCDILLYNPNKADRGIVDCSGIGSLYLDSKGKADGVGRLFLYFQTAFGDSSDNYMANSASNVKWGEKSAFNALSGCKNDTEAWKALIRVYKHLYPEPTVFKGWRGEDIEVTWDYALQENFTMARMMRWEGDTEVNIYDVFEKLKVNPDAIP